VKHRLKNDTNINFDVEVLEPNSLERAISKANRVDDRRPRFRLG
jgi:phenylacetate-CoA ligase